MHPADTLEIKAFVPARDFALSLAFYTDLGFELRSSGGGIAYLRAGTCSFLLQDFGDAPHAHVCQMHLLVRDVQVWYDRVVAARLVDTYGVRVTPITVQPYQMRDFSVSDPSGVCWIIGENIPGGLHV
ncbi:VOC family protein [Curvibacter sp. HBC61]|uniref:VOC family protein n=1 Tax=Curvibacter cyanobacteriorum TaxID=3026422 RepID=A0ABT5MST2_9BURK|nr:VOC family protein [Curvibacter sp. HBC61]MDD0837108.1 VOC family protein [Curvibacter sp. HBC61]